MPPTFAIPSPAPALPNPHPGGGRLPRAFPKPFGTLTRYILREHLGPLAFGIGLFLFIFLSDKLFQLTDLIVTRRVPPAQVGRLLLWILPAIIAEIAPITWLFATLMAYSRLAQDNEITPLRTAGLSFWRLARPGLLCAAVLSGLFVWFNDGILARANWNFKELHFQIIRQRAAVIIQPRAFISEFDGQVFYIDRKDDATGRLEHILVYSVPGGTKPVRTVLAQEGTIKFHPDSHRVILQLRDGEIHEVSPVDARRYRRMTFQSYDLDLDVNRALARQDITLNRNYSEMTYAELAEQTALKRDLFARNPGLHPGLELHKRVAIPFACLAFSLIGVPFGILVRRGGRGVGFSLSLVLTLVFYLLLVLGRTLGEKGTVAPWLSAWLPNLIIGLVGLVLMIRLSKDHG